MLKITNYPVFTLGSVYSTSASGTEQTTETNISNWPWNCWESQLAGGGPVGYVQALPRIWTRGYRETNLGCGQRGTRIRDRWIASPTRCPLVHAGRSPPPPPNVFLCSILYVGIG